jgi:hypothetical protein
MGGFDQRAAVRVGGSHGGGGRRPGVGRRPTTTPRGAARSSRAGPAYVRGLLVRTRRVAVKSGPDPLRSPGRGSRNLPTPGNPTEAPGAIREIRRRAAPSGCGPSEELKAAGETIRGDLGRCASRGGTRAGTGRRTENRESTPAGRPGVPRATPRPHTSDRLGVLRGSEPRLRPGRGDRRAPESGLSPSSADDQRGRPRWGPSNSYFEGPHRFLTPPTAPRGGPDSSSGRQDRLPVAAPGPAEDVGPAALGESRPPCTSPGAGRWSHSSPSSPCVLWRWR